MSQYNLNRIFKPRHVAVVGASEKAGTIGNALMRNLIDGRFPGTLLPVNPKYKTIHGHESFGSVSALETGVTLRLSPRRNASVFWESERNMDMVSTFLKNKKETDGVSHPEIDRWIDFFTRDKHAAAYEFWYEIHKGIHEMLREYPV